MKTPEEINCGMECIRSNASRICIKPENGQCPRCEQLVSESLGRIQQLESRLAQAEMERDAAVRDLNCNWKCAICKKFTRPVDKCPHYRECGLSYMFWEWRGLCEENTKEDTNEQTST